MKHGGGILEEESWRRNHGGGIYASGNIREAIGRHLGSIWEASGRHMGGIWEASGKLQDPRRLQEAPGGVEQKK